MKSISKIIKPYTPKNFGKDYWSIKGSAQYPMFVAVALGLKPVFDDWVDVTEYDDFVDMCKKYDLVVEPDIIFTRCQEDKEKIIGGESITTTFHIAKKFNKIENGEVHVFVSRSRKQAIETKKFGWYPVIIKNRLFKKPFMDNLRFGKCLGFPDCCVDFFGKYNNWYLYNNPYEIFKNTSQINGKPRGSYYCNNFLMDKTYSLIHHLPCSYRCNETIKFAKKVEEKIYELEPDFVRKSVELLKNPLLVFNEQNFIIFDGTLTKQNNSYHLNYSFCEYVTNPSRPEDTIDFFESLKSGNNMVVENNLLKIKDGTSLIKSISKKPEWFVIDFN